MYSCTKPLSAGLPRLVRLYVDYTPTYNPNFCKITRSDVVTMGLGWSVCVCSAIGYWCVSVQTPSLWWRMRCPNNLL
ncbi:hypothetical protein LSAT2_013147 [Lamellibrachia satsuma]|nr:hypothetical protein LSAT2_013147 [Lamellibrachia satsuma]